MAVDLVSDDSFARASQMSWTDRIALYKEKDNNLWNVNQAWRELLDLSLIHI